MNIARAFLILSHLTFLTFAVIQPAHSTVTGLRVTPPAPTASDTVVVTVFARFANPCWHLDSTACLDSNDRITFDLYSLLPDEEPYPCVQIVIDFAISDTLVGLPAGPHLLLAREWQYPPDGPFPSVDSLFFTVLPTGDGSGDESMLLPHSYSLHQNYPNPFNASTRIRFSVPKETFLTLTIYNVLGQRVASLADGQFAEGAYEAEWDGRDRQGNPVASGIYIYSIAAGSFAQTHQMVLLK